MAQGPAPITDPYDATNIPTVSVTVCAPGSATNCETVDHILLDTHSSGLRIAAAAVPQVLSSLPVETVSGYPLTECSTLVRNMGAYGTVRTADVRLGGEVASAVPIQIDNDADTTRLPFNNCLTEPGGKQMSDYGVNGILGVAGTADCGASCVTTEYAGIYNACPTGTTATCLGTKVALAQQVTNPVSRFAVDNNGVILSMAALPAGGAATAAGTLTFGIGTQSNNAMAASHTFAFNSYGFVKGATLQGNAATLDANTAWGRSTVQDPSTTPPNAVPTLCLPLLMTNFFCPASPLVETVDATDDNGASVPVAINIGNAVSLTGSGNFAFDNLAGNSIGAANATTDITLGMPFFYGRTVYFGYDQTASGGAGPYIGF